MDKKMFAVESKLLEPAQMTSDDKYFQQAYRVYMNLIWLNGEVGPGAGDVAGGQNFHPTDTSVAVLETIEKDLNAAKADYRVIEYPGAVHAFTNPEATALGQKFNLPLKYDAKVDQESKAEAAKFFAADLKK